MTLVRRGDSTPIITSIAPVRSPTPLRHLRRQLFAPQVDWKNVRVTCERPRNLLPPVHLPGFAAATVGGLLLTYWAVRASHLQQIHELRSEILRLSHVADRDPLTGLGNRRSFERHLALEWRRAMRHGSHLTLALVDADNFKRFNDMNGHLAGDAALVAIARSIAGALGRSADGAFRIGGEEFALILPDADQAGAAHIGNRVCNAVRSASIANSGAPAGVLTVSFGSCSAIIQSCDSALDLLAAADRSLYDAKSRGRDCAVSESKRVNCRPDDRTLKNADSLGSTQGDDVGRQSVISLNQSRSDVVGA